ncbi:SigE family RNA polymerase sigma factor [Nonomuraea soli]|uniref:RNA polymerase sigma-70 factor (Sigma-E family) n=1 Tax=Nonomuraea soli TaxID=1032476 RepID=A0A7W0CIE6_9ACTN|nr:SigE family RNA polymerase sigma factor [Nonomuraea soli]MBA2891629.1 RNA polymerase sigma-70 factor (sigma-E family) [Nonomuraea soli]
MEPFEEFVRDRGEALFRYGYALTGNAQDAADLVQEALARLGDRWRRVDNHEAYVRTVMVRQHINAWHRRRRERLVPEVPEQGRFDTYGDADLWAELQALPRKQRAVLVLRYYEDRSDEEIAEMLGISRGTVRSQASRALDKLRIGRVTEEAWR